jgi:hypothetical protein
MSANMSEPNAPGPSVPQPAKAPKKITNAQTVCNERNEKGKLCNGHLKQQNTGGEDARVHLRGDDVLFKCNLCGTYYRGPPLGHLRDPGKMNRFVERELTALLQAAGGTLPAFERSESGALVQVNPPLGGHGAAPAAAKPKPEAAPSAPVEETAEQKRVRKLAEAAQRKASSAPIPGASGPPPSGETPEQKMARLKAVVEEAKRRKEAAAAGGDASPAPVAKPKPASKAVASLDSSPSADEHRPEAEAQAATGQASAVPMSPAAATASPAAAEKKAPPSKPPAGETPEQKIARLKAVVEEAKRRKEAGETSPPTAAAPKPKPAKPAVQAETPVETQSASVTTAVEAEAPPVASAPPVEKKAAPAAVPGPRPGETQEEKIARLKAVVAAAKAKKGG